MGRSGGAAPGRMAQLSQIFWDVDTQADFLSPAGKLHVAGSETILPNLERLTGWAAEHAVPVVASACAHLPTDPELVQWPPHCLVGSAGQQKIPETTLPRQLVLPNRPVALPADLHPWQQIVVEKQELDVFTNPNAAALLARLGHPPVVLYGVVTELCVALAARGLLQRGCQVTLVQDAVAALDAAQAKRLLEELTRLGARLAIAADILAAG
jgi:nicotinamidase/pyrazinamidase